MPGPAPKAADTRRRRNAPRGAGPRRFEAGSRDDAKAPAWPDEMGMLLPGESALWNRLWRLPQAEEWERLALADDVAIYCRFKAAAMLSVPPDTRLSAEVRLLDAKLGVSAEAMRKLEWAVVDAPTDTTVSNANDDGDQQQRETFTG